VGLKKLKKEEKKGKRRRRVEKGDKLKRTKL
jgi:hypothetical protein